MIVLQVVLSQTLRPACIAAGTNLYLPFIASK